MDILALAEAQPMYVRCGLQRAARWVRGNRGPNPPRHILEKLEMAVAASRLTMEQKARARTPFEVLR